MRPKDAQPYFRHGPETNGHSHGPVEIFRAPVRVPEQKPGKTTAPIIDSVSHFQATQQRFIETGRGGDDHPLGVVTRIFNETSELHDAVKSGDRAEIAGELADIFLLMTRVAHSFDIPLALAITDKMARNEAKYNPEEMARLRATGMSAEDVEAHLKAKWDRERDKKEFSRVEDIRDELRRIHEEEVNNGKDAARHAWPH